MWYSLDSAWPRELEILCTFKLQKLLAAEFPHDSGPCSCQVGGSNCFNGTWLRNGAFISVASRKEKAHFMVPAPGLGLWGRDLNGLLLHINGNSS